MMLCFELTMPNRGSWNGRWSGENSLHAILKSVTTSARAESLSGRSFRYRWSDGWSVNISVKLVDNVTARRIRKESQGLCGYEWMIDSILCHGAIYAIHDEIPVKQESVVDLVTGGRR